MTIDVSLMTKRAAHAVGVVARHEGVTWSFVPATELDAAHAAVPRTDGGLVLLAGGSMVLDSAALETWARRVIERSRTVLLYGPAADAMAQAVGIGSERPMVVRCADAADASVAAARLAADGDLILLCPGRPTERGAIDPETAFRLVATHPDHLPAALAKAEAA